MTDLDQQLRDTLADDRWAVPVPPDTLDRVRRARTARRRRTAVLSATTALALVAGGSALLTNLPGGEGSRLSTYANPGTGAVPGITPPFVPDSGRDWLLTSAEWAEFTRTHTSPSPAPGQSVVASPAPLTAQSAELLREVQAAGLPAGATLRREDSVGGQPNAAAVHVTLADGTPVEVHRSSLQEPMNYQNTNDGSPTPELVDVPRTTSAAAIYPAIGYGFPGIDSGANSVVVVSRDGVGTTWAAPDAVALADLRAWAFAAAQHQS